MYYIITSTLKDLGDGNKDQNFLNFTFKEQTVCKSILTRYYTLLFISLWIPKHGQIIHKKVFQSGANLSQVNKFE